MPVHAIAMPLAVRLVHMQELISYHITAGPTHNTRGSAAQHSAISPTAVLHLSCHAAPPGTASPRCCWPPVDFVCVRRHDVRSLANMRRATGDPVAAVVGAPRESRGGSAPGYALGGPTLGPTSTS
jgi:hypothetical protein